MEKLVTYGKYRSIDMESFKNDLVTSSLCQPPLTTETPVYGVDKLAKDYNSTLHLLIDCHAPLKSKTVKACRSVPWYTAKIGAAKRFRRKAERLWGKTSRQEDLHAFKVQRNRVTYMMNVAKENFYTNFIAENSMDQGKLIRTAKKLLAKKKVPSFPGYVDKSVLAIGMGTFFIRKIESIRSDIDKLVNSRPNMVLQEDLEVGPEKALLAFHPLSEDEVLKLVRQSAKKSCPLDPAPTSLVVSCLDALLPVIARIINCSLTFGEFPDCWKEVLVSPLLKKSGVL